MLYFQSSKNSFFQNASDQKTEMEKIKGKMAHEVSKIEERKAKIDDELKEVQVMNVLRLAYAKGITFLC